MLGCDGWPESLGTCIHTRGSLGSGPPCYEPGAVVCKRPQVRPRFITPCSWQTSWRGPARGGGGRHCRSHAHGLLPTHAPAGAQPAVQPLQNKRRLCPRLRAARRAPVQTRRRLRGRLGPAPLSHCAGSAAQTPRSPARVARGGGVGRPWRVGARAAPAVCTPAVRACKSTRARAQTRAHVQTRAHRADQGGVLPVDEGLNGAPVHLGRGLRCTCVRRWVGVGGWGGSGGQSWRGPWLPKAARAVCAASVAEGAAHAPLRQPPAAPSGPRAGRA